MLHKNFPGKKLKLGDYVLTYDLSKRQNKTTVLTDVE